MLLIETSEQELFNEETNEFILIKKQTFQVEHSLVSLSKWESKWRKPFLGKAEKTNEEVIDYVRCMTIGQNIKPETYLTLTKETFDRIEEYISAPMTATWFTEKKHGAGSRETITAELIYYWMIALNIPFECQKWHLNRLLTLIRVCNAKNKPPKKQGPKESLSGRAQLNAARRAQYGSKG